jgi:hypothetical protein
MPKGDPIMHSPRRRFGVLILLSFACLALFQAGCGSSSSSSTPPPTNQALTVEGTWKITASTTTSGSNSAFTAGIVVLAPQSGNCIVNTPIGQFEVTGATTCFLADPSATQGTITNVTGTWDYPPAGFMFGLASADPVPANTSAQMLGFFVETDGVNVEIIDLSGNITASTKTISGTFSCDSYTPCGYSGNFTATHQ